MSRTSELRTLNPVHHPDDASLVSYAAGALSMPLRLVIACHLAQCERCRDRLQLADHLGGALVTSLAETPVDPRRRDALFAALDDLSDDDEAMPAAFTSATAAAESISPEEAADTLPAPLQPWLGKRFSDLRWSTLAPGMKQVKIPMPEGNLRLFRISPGTCMPHHGHGGSEITLVLRGSYSDEVGRFQPGDIADLDPDIEHQPIADRDQDCICLIATDRPLKFTGWVPRLLQPFFGL